MTEDKLSIILGMFVMWAFGFWCGTRVAAEPREDDYAVIPPPRPESYRNEKTLLKHGDVHFIDVDVSDTDPFDVLTNRKELEAKDAEIDRLKRELAQYKTYESALHKRVGELERELTAEREKRCETCQYLFRSEVDPEWLRCERQGCPCFAVDVSTHFCCNWWKGKS